jgi:hypothetical protein
MARCTCHGSRKLRALAGLATVLFSPFLIAGASAGAPITLSLGPTSVLPAITTDFQTEPLAANRILATQPGIDSIVLLSPDQGGSLVVSAPIGAGGQPRFSTMADLTGNGLTDIVTTSPNTGRAYIILQNSPDTFALAASLPIGLMPFAPVAADLSGNGLPDLVVPLRADNEIAILPSLGDGLFSAGMRLSTEAAPEAVLVRDLDGDGTLDLAVVCVGGNSIQVFFGSMSEGSVTFPDPPISVPVGAGPNGLVAADLDGDGRLDLATASSGSSSITILYGKPGRTFEPGPYLFAGTTPQGLVLSDLNLSGHTDLIVSNPSTQSVTVLENEGSRNFIRRTATVPFRPSRVVCADLDGDGLADLLVSSQTSQLTRSLLNRTEVVACPGDLTGDLRVDLADLNSVLSHFGMQNPKGDANGDGTVNLVDLNIVLTNFGRVCGET